MPTEPQLSLFATTPSQIRRKRARSARDDGIVRAADRAERRRAGWSEQATAFLIKYADAHTEFLAEDVLVAAHSAGVADPPDRRAWGGVFQAASRRGQIRRTGFGLAATSHMSPKPLWRRTTA